MIEKQREVPRIGIGTVLFIVFLVLKLTETIDWSWVWVTAPLWIPLVILLVIYLIVFVVVLIASLIEYYL